MSKRPVKRETAVSMPGAGIAKWGKKDAPHQVKLPSGVKLILHEDSDCILLYLGQKDISDKCIDPVTKKAAEPGEVVYLIFHDGKRIVSTPISYGLSEFEFTVDNFYYLHVAGEFKTNPNYNAMKDFEIAHLGAENEIADVDPSRLEVDSIKLTLPNIAELNYNKLNYPLRKETKPFDK